MSDYLEVIKAAQARKAEADAELTAALALAQSEAEPIKTELEEVSAQLAVLKAREKELKEQLKLLYGSSKGGTGTKIPRATHRINWSQCSIADGNITIAANSQHKESGEVVDHGAVELGLSEGSNASSLSKIAAKELGVTEFATVGQVSGLGNRIKAEMEKAGLIEVAADEEAEEE